MKNKDYINEQINNLVGKQEIKDLLLEITDVCMDSNQEVKSGIPNLFLVAEHGSGINYISDIYAEIVKTYRVFLHRCSKKMLELDYHAGMSKDELLRFILRVKKYADIQNCYYGTTLIHIEQGMNGEKFQRYENEWLFEFLMANRENMKFIIHISPQIDAFEEFLCRLGQVIPNRTIRLDYLSVNEWTEYLTKELEKIDVRFTNKGIEAIKDVMNELVEKNYFKGYTTINQLVPIISYECAAKKICTPINEKQVMSLRGVLIQEEVREEKRPIGFM